MFEIIERPPPEPRSLVGLGFFPGGITCGTWLPVEEVDGEPVPAPELWCAVCGRGAEDHDDDDDDPPRQ